MISTYEFPLVLPKSNNALNIQIIRMETNQLNRLHDEHTCWILFLVSPSPSETSFQFLSAPICLFLVCLGTWRCHGSRTVAD